MPRLNHTQNRPSELCPASSKGEKNKKRGPTAPHPLPVGRIAPRQPPLSANQWSAKYGCGDAVMACFAIIALVARKHWQQWLGNALRELSVHSRYGPNGTG